MRYTKHAVPHNEGIMVRGREPYDAKTIAMLHDRHRMASGTCLLRASGYASEKPTLLRYAGSERTLSQTDLEFISRMDVDVESRRHNLFIAEVKKDPRFRPSMLEPPTNFAKARVHTLPPRLALIPDRPQPLSFAAPL